MLATKFGNTLATHGRSRRARSTAGRSTCASACEASLRRLGVETIDLYQQHRVDPDTPIEETVGRAGGAGRRRARSATSACPRRCPPDIRRAAAVHPITSLQSEYSLLERGVEAEVLDTCEELGIGFLPVRAAGARACSAGA